MDDEILMGRKKKIALVAHDHGNEDLLEWVTFKECLLSLHELYGTGTTETILEKEVGLKINKLRSGPLGGDMQI